MEDLYAKFLPQFLAIARARLTTAVTAVNKRDGEAGPAIVRELHALAGEAGLLGLQQVIPIARACELKAKALRGGLADADADALLAALHELEQIIDRIGAASP
jgi:HPt (histidine-containing phosphotransfer) domain-containing protein